MARLFLRIVLGCSAALLLAGPGHAQLLSGIGGMPGGMTGGIPGGLSGGSLGSPLGMPLGLPAGASGVSPAVSPVVDRLNDVGGSTFTNVGSLLDMRRARLHGMIQDHHRVLEADRDGNPVRRGEIMAIDPSAATMARLTAAGFRVLHDERIAGIAVHVVTIGTPNGKNSRDGLTRIRAIAPEGEFDYDHVYEPAGAEGLRPGGSTIQDAVSSRLPSIGMIDGGVSVHPSLRNAAIEQRGFAPQGPRPSGHGTAVASLMVGSDGRFQGVVPGASLLVADVFGGDPTEGSAVTIARALGWLTERGVRVINVSLVGPANPLLARAVAAAQDHGVLIVAAVGNDGPAAPPSYPASYPGVIAVTAVDKHDHALMEAGKALHLDFAAPGADMAAALPGSGYAIVRGTSFAAPLVTARLIAAGGGPAALATVSREAVPGSGRVGKGIVCGTCRVQPRTVGARR